MTAGRPETAPNALPGAIPYPDEGEERFSLWRLCTCPTCEGDGHDHTLTSYARSVSKCPECAGEGRVRQEIATAGSPEAVGVALVTLAREGEWIDAASDPCQFGLLDRTPECEWCDGGRLTFAEGCKECHGSGVKSTGTWLVLPFPATARTASAAGRLLQSRRPK